MECLFSFSFAKSTIIAMNNLTIDVSSPIKSLKHLLKTDIFNRFLGVLINLKYDTNKQICEILVEW